MAACRCAAARLRMQHGCACVGGGEGGRCAGHIGNTRISSSSGAHAAVVTAPLLQKLSSDTHAGMHAGMRHRINASVLMPWACCMPCACPGWLAPWLATCAACRHAGPCLLLRCRVFRPRPGHACAYLNPLDQKFVPCFLEQAKHLGRKLAFRQYPLHVAGQATGVTRQLGLHRVSGMQGPHLEDEQA